MPSTPDLLSLEAICGMDLPPERLAEVLAAYRDILSEIQRLRELDLTDVHPPIVFDPLAVFRGGDPA